MIFDMEIGEHHETGARILSLTRACADDAPPLVREAWHARSEANATGVCPLCDAELQLPGRHERRKAKALGGPVHAVMVHEDSCPAGDDGLLRSWVSGTN